MRYRQEYFRDEAELYRDNLEAMAVLKKKELGNKADRGWERRVARKNEELAMEFFRKQEAFNKQCYKEIENITESMDEKFKLRFDNNAAGFALMCEEFLKAKNTTELLTLAKLYNEGLLDTVFEETRKQNEKNSNGNGNATNDSELQEEQPTTDSTIESNTEPTDDRHVQVREV